MRDLFEKVKKRFTASEYRVVSDEDGMGTVLLTNSEDPDEISAQLKATGANGLRFSRSLGWKGNSIEFLKDLTDRPLSTVEICAHDVSDLSPLALFSDLQKVGLVTKSTKGFRLSDFPNLSHFAVAKPKKTNFDTSSKSLTKLQILGFNDADTELFRGFPNLQHLNLTGRKIKSLDGLSSCPSIKTLQLFELRACEDYSPIRTLKDLTDLTLYGCSNLGGLEFLPKHGLSSLTIENCKTISSIQSLRDQTDLRVLDFSGSTNVEDGDLSPIEKLTKLEALIFDPRRHYNRKRHQLIQ